MLKMSHGIPVAAAALLLAGCATSSPNQASRMSGDEISAAVNAEVDAALAVYTEPEEEVATVYAHGISKDAFARISVNAVAKDLLVLSLTFKDGKNAETKLVIDKTAKTLSMTTEKGDIVFSFPKRKMKILKGEALIADCGISNAADLAYFLYGFFTDSVRIAKSVKLQSHSMFVPGTKDVIEEADSVLVDGRDCKRFDVKLKPSCGVWTNLVLFVAIDDNSIVRMDMRRKDGSVTPLRIHSEAKSGVLLPTKIVNLSDKSEITVVDSSVKLVPPPEPPKPLVGVKTPAKDEKSAEANVEDDESENAYESAAEESLDDEADSDEDVSSDDSEDEDLLLDE